jgi:ferritin
VLTTRTDSPRFFADTLRASLGILLTSSQQFIAVAVRLDALALPQLAGVFYQRSIRSRTQAMQVIRFLLDRNDHVEIPPLNPIENTFESANDVLRLALSHEVSLMRAIEGAAGVARAQSDFLGERFLQPLLADQLTSLVAMRTLTTIATRDSDDLFEVESFVARESFGSTR